METTLVLLKPDAVRRNLMAEIIGRFERRGFRFRGMRLIQLDRATAEAHYAEHSERPFFGELVDFITSGPILALLLAENIIHGSDSVESAERELAIYFPDGLL